MCRRSARQWSSIWRCCRRCTSHTPLWSIPHSVSLVPSSWFWLEFVIVLLHDASVRFRFSSSSNTTKAQEEINFFSVMEWLLFNWNQIKLCNMNLVMLYCWDYVYCSNMLRYESSNCFFIFIYSWNNLSSSILCRNGEVLLLELLVKCRNVVWNCIITKNFIDAAYLRYRLPNTVLIEYVSTHTSQPNNSTCMYPACLDLACLKEEQLC